MSTIAENRLINNIELTNNKSTITVTMAQKGVKGDTGSQGIQGDTGSQGIQGDTGSQGIQGDTGATGSDGADGEGVAIGGSTGEVLAKVDGTDFNTQWVSNSLVTSWGAITGTVSNQTDLQSELDGKEDSFTKNTGFNLNLGAIAGTVVEGSDARLSDARTPLSHQHVEADITDLQSYLLNINGGILNDLSNVVITANVAGELLVWNGTNWINNTLVEAGIAPTVHTHATSDITSGTFDNARIAESNVTQHQSALSITESQISDLQSYLLNINGEILNDLSNVTITTIATDEILQWNGTVWINQTLSEAGIEPAFSKNTAFNDNYGTGAGTVTEANDSRLSDARTPLSHQHVEVDITDLDKYTQAEVDASLALKQDYAQYIKAVPFLNGATYKTTDIDVTSDGTTVLASVTLGASVGGPGDFDVILDTADFTYDSTQTVALTTGSDTNPVLNYVYIIDVAGTATLAASITDFPSTEAYSPVMTTLIQSATGVQSYLPYKSHAWTDHISDEHTGHMAHINKWVRNQDATWLSGGGCIVNITTNGGSADNIEVETSAAEVLQLHQQTYQPHGTTTDRGFVVNDFTTPYRITNDFNNLLTDSQGNSMSASRFNIVVWGVSSGDGQCKMMCNLPLDSDNKDVDAIGDLNDYADYTIPHDFKGVGFLIARLTFRHTTASGGTWTLLQNESLLGKIPNVSAGGGSIGINDTEFVDTEFRIDSAADVTKQLAFDVGGITTSTTRTITMVDSDIDLTPATGTYASNAQGALADSALQIGDNVSVLTNDSGYLTEVNWGDVTGTLSNQTDLQNALDAKEDNVTANTAYNKDFGVIAGTVTEANDARLSDDRTPLSHTHLKADITDSDWISNVVEDTSPKLGGGLRTLGNEIVITTGGDVVEGLIGDTTDGFAMV
ncbi:MAG: hypothetical protein DRH08_14025, partial [Deltaproteobacteria bacterium]